MVKPFDADDIISRNPQVDRQQLEKVRGLFRRLREKGVLQKGYGLASPYGGQEFTVRDDPRSDPRSVRLTRPEDGT
jgi:hypothetical protein